jgi:hypothetical protein
VKKYYLLQIVNIILKNRNKHYITWKFGTLGGRRGLMEVVLQHPVRTPLDTTLCDKACQWFSAGTLVSSTNKTDHYDITEILLKVALNTINLSLNHIRKCIKQLP